MLHNSTRSSPPARRESGLTLVELMVVMTVLVILLATAGPSLNHFAASNQLVTTKSSFASALAIARSEAAKRGTTVLLAARGTPAAGNEFAAGWDVVVDTNGNGVADDADTLVRRYDVLPSTIKLSGTATVSFGATGYLSTVTDRTYTVCRASGGPDGFRITVAASGVTDVLTIGSCT